VYFEGSDAIKLRQRELEMDLTEFDRIEKDISTGKIKLHKAKNVEEIFA